MQAKVMLRRLEEAGFARTTMIAMFLRLGGPAGDKKRVIPQLGIAERRTASRPDWDF